MGDDFAFLKLPTLSCRGHVHAHGLELHGFLDLHHRKLEHLHHLEDAQMREGARDRLSESCWVHGVDEANGLLVHQGPAHLSNQYLPSFLAASRAHSYSGQSNESRLLCGDAKEGQPQ
jgi:hypothetical protein